MRKFLLILTSMSLFIASFAIGSPIKVDETVIFFPTNASLYQNSQVWVVPIHGWIFELEEDSFWRSVTMDSLTGLLEVEPDAETRPIHDRRVRMFLVDNQRGKEIEVELSGKRGTMNASRPNGHFYGILHIDRDRVGKQHWVNFRTIISEGDERVFTGEVQLIEPQGVSVISDIDDTIKVSNVKDKKALLQNTFLKEFAAVPGMADLYRSWAKQGVAFHYLSASPWQLYPAMSEFISTVGFPKGSFNLKYFRMKDETFFNLFSSQEEYKKPVVENLLKKYPDRKFILVGDSGEEDPEIFAKVARANSQQVLHIFIRNVTDDSAQGARFTETFKGIPKDRWTLFMDGKELAGYKIKK
jgi:phosphatidate phosphatase APP1